MFGSAANKHWTVSIKDGRLGKNAEEADKTTDETPQSWEARFKPAWHCSVGNCLNGKLPVG